MPSMLLVAMCACLLGCPVAVLMFLLRQRGATHPATCVLTSAELAQAGGSEQVANFIASGNIVAAISAYRYYAEGVGLADAKRAVAALIISVRLRALLASGLADRILRLTSQGHTDRAAQAYRSQTGVSTGEAKASIAMPRAWTD
jgi:hypothetical protein